MKVEKVELRHAYQWTCDNCGVDQFESAIIAELSEEDKLEAAKRFGIVDEFAETFPEDRQGDFYSYPPKVTCNQCGSQFEALAPNEGITEYDEYDEYDEYEENEENDESPGRFTPLPDGSVQSDCNKCGKLSVGLFECPYEAEVLHRSKICNCCHACMQACCLGIEG